MLKMLKYEYRRAVGPLTIIFMLFGILEVYILGATALKKESHSGIGITLFLFGSFACYIFVLIYGIVTYNKDLKSKEGYLVFMAPISSFSVIGAKLLSILLTGITLVVMIALLGMLNYSAIASAYHLDSLVDVLEMFLESGGMSLSGTLAGIGAFIIAFLIQFFMTTTLIYFAISVSATVLQNKKGKGFVSFVLFMVLQGGVSALAASLPNMHNMQELQKISDMAQAIGYMWPQLLCYAVVMVLAYTASSVLLDKKISL